MKKMIALLLALVLCCGCLTACANGDTPETTTEAAPADDGVLRVLLLGHSLGNDSLWLVPEIAKNEGYTDMVFGMLYHSGCRLRQHVQYLTKDAKEYDYRQYDLSKDSTWQIADTDGVFHTSGGESQLDTAQTMKFSIQQQDWDIVVLQAGLFEQTGDTTDGKLDTGHIQTIMDYVLENDIDKSTKPQFAWNQTWGCPEDFELNKESFKTHLSTAFTDSHDMFEHICSTLKDKIAVEYDFAYIMPTGTAFWNAHSSYMGDSLYRDYIHGTDYARVVAAYTWLCTLTGADMSKMKIPTISAHELKELHQGGLTLTGVERDILVESVSNALKTPYEMTQSAYTEKPAN